jgi:hypothetical protein
MFLLLIAACSLTFSYQLQAETKKKKEDESVQSTDESKKKRKVRYKAGKRHDFDAANIDGKIRKPEISLVTGGERTNDNGLLRLREDWLDRLTIYSGEELK